MRNINSMTIKEGEPRLEASATYIIQSLLAKKEREDSEKLDMKQALGACRISALTTLKAYGKTTTEMIKGKRITVLRTPKIDITTKDYPAGIAGTIHLEQVIGTLPNGDDASDQIAVVLKVKGQQSCHLFLLEPDKAFGLQHQLETPADFKQLETVMYDITNYFQKKPSSQPPAGDGDLDSTGGMRKRFPGIVN